MSDRAVLPACLVAVTALALSGCGDGAAAAGARDAAAEDGALQVVAAFYPLEFVTERVAGDRATVTGLTAPGAEPHDLELSPQDVAALTDADLVVHESGFQPAVDDAIESGSGENALDVTPAADLDLSYEVEEGHGSGGHEGEQAADPHFWLDPTRLSSVVEAVGARLAEVDPEGAQTYAANAEELTGELADLDADFEQGLVGCTARTVVTSHEAFGYLAQRYGFEQLGISGLSPDEEPDAGRLAEVADFVTANDVGTIYFETLVAPDVAEVVAAETGAATAVLDPIEGLTDESAGSDYLEVQRANLEALRVGQSCS